MAEILPSADVRSSRNCCPPRLANDQSIPQRGLPSSWTRFHNIPVEVPDLLHLVKSVRTLPNSPRAAASSSPQVWIQVDELRRQGAGTVNMVNQVHSQTWRALEKQNQVAQQLMVSTFAALSAIHASLESTCGYLKERMIRYRKTPEIRQSLLSEQGSTLFYQKPNTNTVEWKRKKILLPSSYLLYNLHRAHSSLINQPEILGRVYHKITA
ncbi:uncharacterized protein HD556DRAFT_991704 [Suillus plorans]|uniref:Uncharacterized protein n=1 Tax=Suillus plorans TaxID=116603 RepID=A0A9P7AF86_9AGAM|nr:uncharacterized protein HD556DRAFT_991704 [Suillus plorans]KAG1787127.1 hypothetical protein HD556DRAFT_991704 [Suillus plorans]